MTVCSKCPGDRQNCGVTTKKVGKKHRVEEDTETCLGPVDHDWFDKDDQYAQGDKYSSRHQDHKSWAEVRAGVWDHQMRFSSSSSKTKLESLFNFFFQIYIYIFIYLAVWIFVAAPWLALVVASGDFCLVEVQGLLTGVASLVAEHRL